jgi:hypothetical protein
MQIRMVRNFLGELLPGVPPRSHALSEVAELATLDHVRLEIGLLDERRFDGGMVYLH